MTRYKIKDDKLYQMIYSTRFEDLSSIKALTPKNKINEKFKAIKRK